MVDDTSPTPPEDPGAPAEPPGHASTDGPALPDPNPDPDAGLEVEHPDEPDTYPAEHVRELRDEIAKRRLRAKEVTATANARLLAAYAHADGRLVEPDALALSDELLGEDGFVDPAKVGDAVAALVQAKPHLASRRPSGSLPLGVRPEAPATPGLFSLIDAARSG